MGLFDSIKSVFGGGGAAPSPVSRDAGRVYLVDAEKMADTREGGRPGPSERFRAIQILASFAEREKVTMVAVVGGRPLREVAHGEAFNGVRVFYAEAEQSLADQIQRVLDRELRGRATVVTNDKELETALRGRGVSTLRLSSLRRAMDGGSGEGGGDGGGRGRDRDRDRNRRRGGGRRPGDERRDNRPERESDGGSAEGNGGQNEGGEGEGEDASQERVASPAPEQRRRSSDTIDNLIDRVD